MEKRKGYKYFEEPWDIPAGYYFSIDEGLLPIKSAQIKEPKDIPAGMYYSTDTGFLPTESWESSVEEIMRSRLVKDKGPRVDTTVFGNLAGSMPPQDPNFNLKQQKPYEVDAYDVDMSEMKKKSQPPQGSILMEKTMAYVQTEISLHQLIKGLEDLAEVYPCERLAPYDITRIETAARILRDRLAKYQLRMEEFDRSDWDIAQGL
jgi:hypothetical protein